MPKIAKRILSYVDIFCSKKVTWSRGMTCSAAGHACLPPACCSPAADVLRSTQYARFTVYRCGSTDRALTASKNYLCHRSSVHHWVGCITRSVPCRCSGLIFWSKHTTTGFGPLGGSGKSGGKSFKFFFDPHLCLCTSGGQKKKDSKKKIPMLSKNTKK